MAEGRKGKVQVAPCTYEYYVRTTSGGDKHEIGITITRRPSDGDGEERGEEDIPCGATVAEEEAAPPWNMRRNHSHSLSPQCRYYGADGAWNRVRYGGHLKKEQKDALQSVTRSHTGLCSGYIFFLCKNKHSSSVSAVIDLTLVEFIFDVVIIRLKNYEICSVCLLQYRGSIHVKSKVVCIASSAVSFLHSSPWGQWRCYFWKSDCKRG